MLLKDRVAIVTGGARGIGKAIALKYADEGCAVAIADIREKEGQQTVEEIGNKGGRALFVPFDQMDLGQIKAMADTVYAKFGQIDILVNNAGYFGPPTPLAKMTEEEWDRSLDLNLKGVFFCCQAVAPYMIERRYGKIINISSVAAITSGPPSAHYAAAKGGVLTLTIDLAGELGPYNICVNAILPGSIRTDLWGPNVPPGVDPDEFFAEMGSKMILLGRAGWPEDVAGPALFFASHLSDYITGDRLIVAGGFPLQKPPF